MNNVRDSFAGQIDQRTLLQNSKKLPPNIPSKKKKKLCSITWIILDFLLSTLIDLARAVHKLPARDYKLGLLLRALCVSLRVFVISPVYYSIVVLCDPNVLPSNLHRRSVRFVLRFKLPNSPWKERRARGTTSPRTATKTYST